MPGKVNGHDAGPHTPVTPTGSGRWSVRMFGSVGEGYFSRDALPDRMLAARTVAIANALGAAAHESPAEPGSPDETAYERWVAVPPLATDLIAQLRGVSDDPVDLLEQAIDADLGRLEAVCQHPETRLRPETSVVLLSRTRRIAQDAITYLAAHTEDWQRRSVTGVFPRRLRAIHNDPDPDLYENQAAVQLVDHLITFLEWRRQKLEATSSILADLEELAGQLRDRPWRTGLRLARLVGEFANHLDLNDDVRRLLGRTREHRRRLGRLLTSRLYRDRRVSRRTEFSSDLRQTNMFIHHEDYRRVAALWRAWARVRREVGLHFSIAPRAFCNSYDQFVALLAARSLDTLGYQTTTADAPTTGGPGIYYTGPGDDTVVLRIRTDGSVEVNRNDRPLLVCVPLPHPLTANGAPDLLPFVDELDQTRTHADAPRVVVYPGTRQELQALPPRLRARADTVGNDLPGGPGIGLLPATPTEIDSVERITRALQWARIASDAAQYPPRVHCPEDLLGELAAAGERWLSATTDERHLALERPPTQAERMILRDRVARWRAQRVPPSRRRERHIAADALNEAVEAALVRLHRLAHCPVCGAELGSPRDFHPRSGTFVASCRRCHNEWGTRSCGSCGTNYPVIQTGNRQTVKGRSDATSRPGNEVLATPCWQAAVTAAYICPNCGKCGGSAVRSEPECQRCPDSDEWETRR
ncbi:TFIIB-type zinc finger domain-containing protein [Micromonospora sp. DT227]|uniref:TFIIB-type zinc finger domain-containing protein n=1 Tax=Micromonospora sp. DT227 TaxID=3393433 RepID=UPI003CEFC9A9